MQKQPSIDLLQLNFPVVMISNVLIYSPPHRVQLESSLDLIATDTAQLILTCTYMEREPLPAQCIQEHLLDPPLLSALPLPPVIAPTFEPSSSPASFFLFLF